MSSDIRLFWNNKIGEGDIQFLNGDFVTGKELETAVLLSIFTDARVQDFKEGDKSGWWGDLLQIVEDENVHITGSKIWSVRRQKITQHIINLIKAYCYESLSWISDEGIASEINIDVNIDSVSNATEKIVVLNIQLVKSERDILNIVLEDMWDAQVFSEE